MNKTQILIGAVGLSFVINVLSMQVCTAATVTGSGSNKVISASGSTTFTPVGGQNQNSNIIQNQVSYLYNAIFGKTPTQKEVDAWAPKIIAYQATIADTAKAYFNSAQFKALSATNKVNALYNVIMGKPASAFPTSTYLLKLYTGGSQSLLDIAKTIMTNTLFQNRSASDKDYVVNQLKITSALTGVK